MLNHLMHPLLFIKGFHFEINPLHPARFLGALFFLAALPVAWTTAVAQDSDYDPSWYNPSQSYVKIAVTEDGVYQVRGTDLAQAGVNLSAITPSSLRLLEHGQEIPLVYEGNASTLTDASQILFVGKRNQGTDESWAYRDPAWQSSTYNSLYTDTTHYWLTWGSGQGLRYTADTPAPLANVITTYRDTLFTEPDNTYYPGDSGETENPFYTRGEGNYWNGLRHNNSNNAETNRTNTFNLINDARTGLAADSIIVWAKVNSRTPTAFRIQLALQTEEDGSTNYRVYDEVSWSGYQFGELRGAAGGDAIPDDNQNRFRVRLISFNDAATFPHQSYVDFIHISYIRTLTAVDGRLDFAIERNEGGQFALNGFLGGAPVLVFNPQARWFQALTTTPEGDVSFSHQPTRNNTYWTTTRDALLAPAAIQLDTTSDLLAEAQNIDYLIISSALLRPSADALAMYRSSQNGYETLVVDIQDIYDQFDYGRPTPIAVRRFLRTTRESATPTRFVTLWGDALYADRTRPRPLWEVISYGQASSDGWLVMQGEGEDDWTEFTAIGRLPLRDNEAGLLFLQKLQSYEAAPLDDWNKEMIMMVGSRDLGEQNLLGNHINRWAGRALAPPTGMDTTRFVRTVSDELPPDASLQDSIRVSLRVGSSWLCYFGHSAAVTWDIVVDPPAEFNNAGRLPLALSLGCRTGAFGGGANVDGDVPVLAEQLVLGSLNGAIAHWGTSGLSTISASARLGDETHELVFGDTLRVIGAVFQEAKRRYATSGAFSLRDLVQFGLIGDPATTLNIPVQPDLVATSDLIRIEPLAPVPADSQLTVLVTPRNLGLVPSGPVQFRLLHTPPGGAALPYDSTITDLETPLAFSVRINDGMVGTNNFMVQVDPDNVYDEVSELNNTAETSHVIFSTNVDLVAPRNLSVITGSPLSLRVAFTPEENSSTRIAFELDSSPTFDSPNLLQFEDAFTAGFAIWEITQALATEQPYYWRARVNDPDELTRWQESAFYLAASGAEQAWQQNATFFDRNTQSPSLVWDGALWSFTEFDREIEIASSGNNGILLGRILVDGISYQGLSLGYGIVVLNGTTGEVRAQTAAMPYANDFESPDDARARLDTLFTETVQENDYVLVRTRHIVAQETEIAEDIKALWRGLGSTAIDTLDHNDLWTMVARIGHPDETVEMAIESDVDLVQDARLFFRSGSGTTQSPRIGPARTWESISWDGTLPNAASEISVTVLDGETDAVLLDDLSAPGALTDLSAISAQETPFLRLQATLSDSSRQATPQLLQWAVNFSTVSEVVLDPATFTLSADTLNEGDVLTATGALLNLSDQPTDSVLVELRLTDTANRTSVVGADTIASIPPLGTVSTNFTIATEGLEGTNRLTLEAEQPSVREPVTINNIAFTEFTVRGDEMAPTLMVSVEGDMLPHDPEPVRDLQSPDIPVVSAQPTIEIVFADENPFKLLQDTTLATVTLENVSEGVTRTVYFQSNEVSFEPATEARNEARIIFTPDFTDLNAVFTLRVRAFDVAGNEAIGSPYQVHFRVITAIDAFGVSSLYPYPNPMGSFTRFAFELRGSDPSVVDDLRIRIYTLTGRVVREFNLVENPALLESGGLRIGWNKMLWDGTDEDGDQVATGVYLYKVIMRANGEDLDINDEAIEKLVVLR